MTRRRLATAALLLALGVGVGLAWAYAGWPEEPLPHGARADKVVVRKSERRLMLMKDGRVLKQYRIALGRNPVGHKTEEGDGRTPEGFYRIDGRNAKSGYRLSLHISYPDESDRAQARERGVSPGGDIMIHGMKNGLGWVGPLHLLIDWTNGCIAVTDAEIEEIWRAVPNGIAIEIHA
jgi:murein L,D-transpeptidase YafK